jgi:hypothetical protein
MRGRWKKICAFGALPALISAGIIGLSSGPAYATGGSCADPTFTYNITLCITVVGGGDYIDYVTATMTSTNPPPYLNGHLQITNPNGSTLCNSGTRYFGAPGESETCTWSLHAETLTGNYCATAWFYDGSYFEGGQACVNVWV